jgi:hypothetical protein
VFKYKPLYDFLRRKPGPEVELSYSDIERVISQLLPKSASRRQWWANERSLDSRQVQCAAWLDAGYNAFASPEEERVIFKKLSQ